MFDGNDIAAVQATLITEWHYTLLVQSVTLVLALIAAGLVQSGGLP